MDSRKENIFKTIIKEYIKTAAPVSSQDILAMTKLPLSSATIRNEMADLESLGLIYQPHTSAGRVPTTKGYQTYVAKYLDNFVLPINFLAVINRLLESKTSGQVKLKNYARATAAISKSLVFIAFEKNDLYYTGLSNLFAQPEFNVQEKICSFSLIIDRFDEIIKEHFHSFAQQTNILVGSQNPFCEDGSLVVGAFQWQKKKSLFGIIGPLRMPYELNLSLVKYLKNKYQ